MMPEATSTLQVISVDIPNTVQLEVTETAPGVKGNTVSGGTKAATLETGAVIQVSCRAAIFLMPSRCDAVGRAQL